MKLNAHIPPTSPAVTVAHRALIATRIGRLYGHHHPRSGAIARALRDVAAGRLAAGEREWLARIEARRAEIPFEFVAADANARSDRGIDAAEHLGRAWEVCRWVSIPPVWGRFLTRLVGELSPGCCIELGTGLGVSGAHQAAALELLGRGHMTTMDNHEASKIAERGFSELGLEHRIELRFGDIDETLAPLLEQIAPIDYALLDAAHSESETVRHFDAVLPYLSDGAVVVLDDITQTSEMKRAWRTIAGRDRVSLALGLRRIGVLGISGPARRPSAESRRSAVR